MKKSKSKFSKYLNGGDPKKPIQGTKEQAQAYQDSIYNYNLSLKEQEIARNIPDRTNATYGIPARNKINEIHKQYKEGINPIGYKEELNFLWKPGIINSEYYVPREYAKPTQPVEYQNQPVEYQKPNSNKPTYEDSLYAYKKYIEKARGWDNSEDWEVKDDVFNTKHLVEGSDDSKVKPSLLKSTVRKREYPDVHPSIEPIGFGSTDGAGFRYPVFAKPKGKPSYQHPIENISKLKTKDLGLVNSNTSKANTLPVNKTKFNTDNNYSITHGIGKDRSQVYFPDEETLNEAVTNLRTKYPKSVQSQKSKGKANYDFPGATNDEVMKFKNGGKLRKMPDGGIIKPPIQTTDINKVRAYQDSLQLHNLTKGIYDGMLGDMKNGVLPAEKVPYHISKMDEIIPKTDSLVNDLYDMGINYKVKGYNKVPIGSNGNFTEVGKLQKVAPMPKQPYFFKGGGKLNKSELSLTNKENFYNQEIPWNTIAENSLNIGKTSLNYSKNLGGNRKLPSDRDFISLELAGGMDRTQEKKDPWINNSEIINKNSPNLKAGLKYNSDVLDGENKKYTVPIQVEGGVKFADNRLTPYTNFRAGVQRNFMNHQGNKIGSINPYLDLGWGIDGKAYENRLSGTEHINAGIKGELNLNKFGRRNKNANDLYLSGDISKNGSTGATQAEVGMGYKFKDGGKVYPKNYKPSLSPAPDTINFHALQDRILAKPHKMSAPKITEEQKRLPKHTFGSFLGENLGSIGSLAGGIALSATGAGAAVGVPMILGGASGLATGAINEFTKQDPQDTSTPIRQTYNPNPYGNSFKNGGFLEEDEIIDAPELKGYFRKRKK